MQEPELKASIIQKVSENLAMDTDDVEAVVNEFMLNLHRSLFEESKGDDIHSSLYRELPRQAYFHFMLFLERFSEWFGELDSYTVTEYLTRLGGRAAWQPFVHQMASWTEFPPPSRPSEDLQED